MSTVEDLRERHVGKRVLITGPEHPYRDRTGEVTDFQSTSAGLMMTVRADDGHEVGVFAGQFKHLSEANHA